MFTCTMGRLSRYDAVPIAFVEQPGTIHRVKPSMRAVFPVILYSKESRRVSVFQGCQYDSVITSLLRMMFYDGTDRHVNAWLHRFCV